MRSTSRLVAGIVAAALLAGSPVTAATVQSAAPAVQARNGWATLAMLTPVSGTTLGQSAAAAAQPVVPPPPPPPPSDIDAGIPPPPIPVLVVLALWLATIIYIATKNNGNGAPNSPA